MSEPYDVIVVAGHAALVAALVARLQAGGHARVVGATSAAEALELIDASAAELMLVDRTSFGPAGDQLLRAAHERWPDLPLIALSDTEDHAAIVEALAAGASDVVSLGVAEELELALKKALLRARRPAPAPAPPPGAGDLVLGRSRAMRAVAQRLGQIAPSAAAVLVRGESGTGKELVARALHRMSPLSARPFVKIDCASARPTLATPAQARRSTPLSD